jgi:hypothetical protein
MFAWRIYRSDYSKVGEQSFVEFHTSLREANDSARANRSAGWLVQIELHLVQRDKNAVISALNRAVG